VALLDLWKMDDDVRGRPSVGHLTWHYWRITDRDVLRKTQTRDDAAARLSITVCAAAGFASDRHLSAFIEYIPAVANIVTASAAWFGAAAARASSRLNVSPVWRFKHGWLCAVRADHLWIVISERRRSAAITCLLPLFMAHGYYHGINIASPSPIYVNAIEHGRGRGFGSAFSPLTLNRVRRPGRCGIAARRRGG
jgi:hypothetical protein